MSSFRGQSGAMLGAFLVILFTASSAIAQSTNWGARGFVQFGRLALTASDTFKTLTGESAGSVLGGGAQLLIRRSIFVQVSFDQFRKSGERVFLYGADRFGLGIRDTVTIQPILLTGGYRFIHRNIAPYVGGGFGSYSLKEDSDFSVGEENVSERFNGYHILGGADFSVLPWLAVGGELQWATVGNALGRGGISEVLREDDLGGTTVRLKVLIGR